MHLHIELFAWTGHSNYRTETESAIHTAVRCPRLDREGMGPTELHPEAGQNYHHFATFRGQWESKTKLVGPAAVLPKGWLQYSRRLILCPPRRAQEQRHDSKILSPSAMGAKPWLQTRSQRSYIPGGWGAWRPGAGGWDVSGSDVCNFQVCSRGPPSLTILTGDSLRRGWGTKGRELGSLKRFIEWSWTTHPQSQYGERNSFLSF